MRSPTTRDHAKRVANELERDSEQHLPGVEAPTLRAILQRAADRPLTHGSNRELAHDSLFGDAHKQRELF